MARGPVLWCSDFPVEWLEGFPLRWEGPPRHPLTWMRVLFDELQRAPTFPLHVAVLRKEFTEDADIPYAGAVFHLRKVRGGRRLPTLFAEDTARLRALAAEVRPAVVHAWGLEHGAAVAAPRLGLPCVATVQGLLSWYRRQAPLSRYQWVLSWLEGWAFRRARVVTAESRFGVDWARRQLRCRDVRPAEHAPHPRFAAVARAPANHPPRLLFVGQAGPLKGTDTLVAALAELAAGTDFRLAVAGGAEEGFWEAQRAARPGAWWERVELLGRQPPAAVAELYWTATLLVFPTRADTSPNAVKEAAVAGLPVVASAVGGIPDYVWPGRNGLLVPAGDAPALAQALREALAHPRFGRGEVEPAALAEARDYLSAARMAATFRALYAELAGEAGPSG